MQHLHVLIQDGKVKACRLPDQGDVPSPSFSRRSAPSIIVFPLKRVYLGWSRRFFIFHGKQRPRETGKVVVAEILNDLARPRGVAAATQNLTPNALLCLFDVSWDVRSGVTEGLRRVQRPRKTPS
ncbi:MAG: phage integrase N-terminal SAM-like domain-containing protein [Chthoniobacterales bacterium]